MVKQGRRVVAFEAQAWQDDPTKPIGLTINYLRSGRALDS